MNKTELQSGMLIAYRNGKKRLVINTMEGLVLADTTSANFLPLSDYTENLEFNGSIQKCNSDWDIVEVYGFSHDLHDAFTMDTEKRDMLYPTVKKQVTADIDNRVNQLVETVLAEVLKRL